MALRIFRFYWRNKVVLIALVTSLLTTLLPILLPVPEAKCGFILILMAICLITEAVPMAITGLLPMLFAPLFGLMTSEKLARCYMKDLTVLFLCSVALAALMEKSNLHRRIALNVMRTIGVDSNRLLTGFMLVTWFFSMWMSNAATVAMILPIIDALINQRQSSLNDENCAKISGTPETGQEDARGKQALAKVDGNVAYSADSGLVTLQCDLDGNSLELASSQSSENAAGKTPATSEKNNCMRSERLKALRKEQKMLILAVAFAAACGGMVTITGSSTNLVLLGLLSEYRGHGLNFASWFIVAFPISLFTMVLSWLWLTYYFCGVSGLRQTFSKSQPKAVKSESEEFIDFEYRRLGKFKYEEGCTLVYFTILVILWMTRDVGGIGWGKWFKVDDRGVSYVGDSQAGLLIVCLSVITPNLSWLTDPNGEESKTKKPSKFLLTWADITKIIPWDIMFLVGGGIAISEACRESGLSRLFASHLGLLSSLQPWIILIVVVCLSVTLTQFLSNQAVCSIMLPVLFDMAKSLDINPLYFMFPASLGSSLAFILPIASTSNAVAFAAGHVTTGEMAKAGFVVNLIGLVILLLSVFTYGSAYILNPALPFNRSPQIIDINNITTSIGKNLDGHSNSSSLLV